MNSRRRTVSRIAVLLFAMILVISSQLTVYAGQSDDNSLSSLGITTQGATVSPDFSYDHLNYDVVVPAGTTELALDPVLSNPNATINSVEGTTLTDGAGTVTITTTAPSGAMTMYTLNVTTAADTNVDPAEAIAAQEQQTAAASDQPSTTAQADVAQKQETAAAAAQSETQTESETEDSRYVKVDKNTLQDAEDTITRLQKELQDYKNRSHQFTYIIYGLIAVGVILLFLVVNLALRRKDLAAELKEYKKKKLPEEFEDNADVIPEDGWLDDEPVKPSKKKNRRERSVPRYDQPAGYPGMAPSMTPDGRVNAQTSWTEQQVGTPVQPPREVVPYNGYARSSQARDGRGAGKDSRKGQDVRGSQSGNVRTKGQNVRGAQAGDGRMRGQDVRGAQAGDGSMRGQDVRGAQAGDGRSVGRDVRMPQARRDSEEDASGRVLGHVSRKSKVSDDTRLYNIPQAPADGAAEKVPGGETIVLPGKKLTRAERAAAKKAAKEAKKAQKSVWEQAPDLDAASGRQQYAGTMPAQSEVKASDMPDIRRNVPQPYQSRTRQGGQYTQPVQSSQYTQPVQGGQYTQPVQGSQYTQPVQSSQYAQQAQGSQYTQPAQGGQYTQQAQSSQYAQQPQGKSAPDGGVKVDMIDL